MQESIWRAGGVVVDFPSNLGGYILHRGRAAVAASREYTPWASYATARSIAPSYMGVPGRRRRSGPRPRRAGQRWLQPERRTGSDRAPGRTVQPPADEAIPEVLRRRRRARCARGTSSSCRGTTLALARRANAMSIFGASSIFQPSGTSTDTCTRSRLSVGCACTRSVYQPSCSSTGAGELRDRRLLGTRRDPLDERSRRCARARDPVPPTGVTPSTVARCELSAASTSRGTCGSRRRRTGRSMKGPITICGSPSAGAVLSSATESSAFAIGLGGGVVGGELHPVVDRSVQVVVDLVAGEVRRRDRERVGRTGSRRPETPSSVANACFLGPGEREHEVARVRGGAQHLGDLRGLARAFPSSPRRRRPWRRRRGSRRARVSPRTRRTRRARSR